MAQSTFSLQWEAHRNNICNGLSILQQNGEFVDMTLAADGHFVKVHQMVMALASPYFKELISTAEGRHPVLFLNKISYTTLSAILEYIYTGEVLVSIDNLSELVQTAKELHVRGLEDMILRLAILDQDDMKLKDPATCSFLRSQAQPDTGTEDAEENDSKDTDDEICYFEITGDDAASQKSNTYSSLVLDDEILGGTKSVVISEMDEDITYQEDSAIPSVMQYTISNQGSLQMILNRYVYYLKHSNRNNTRQWRCVDYLNKIKCPALVVTRNNVVLQRMSAHIHGYHDKRILKKVHTGSVYTAIQEAEDIGNQIKSNAKQIEKSNMLEKPNILEPKILHKSNVLEKSNMLEETKIEEQTDSVMHNTIS